MIHKVTVKAAIMALFLLAFDRAWSASELNRIVAVVNGQVITQVDLDEAIITQFRIFMMQNPHISRVQAEKKLGELKKDALQDLIDRKLVLSEFKTMGGKIDQKYVDAEVDNFIQTRFKGDREAFIEGLSKQGITINQFRKNQEEEMAVRALQMKHSSTSSAVGSMSLPGERKAMYEEIKSQHATEGKLKLRMITIPKETPRRTKEQQIELVNRLQRQIKQDEISFVEAAKTYSQDQFAEKEGYVGLVGRGMLNPTLTDIAYNMPNNRVSDVIDDGLVWRLISVDGKTGGSVPSQKELEKEIDQRIIAKKRQNNMEGWMQKLRRDANIRLQ